MKCKLVAIPKRHPQINTRTPSMNKQEEAERKADIVLEFIQEFGRLPKCTECYKNVRVGGFIAAARQYRSSMAIEALSKRGIDFNVGRRFIKPHARQSCSSCSSYFS